jgi:hypothetical protein
MKAYNVVYALCALSVGCGGGSSIEEHRVVVPVDSGVVDAGTDANETSVSDDDASDDVQAAVDSPADALADAFMPYIDVDAATDASVNAVTASYPCQVLTPSCGGGTLNPTYMQCSVIFVMPTDDVDLSYTMYYTLFSYNNGLEYSYANVEYYNYVDGSGSSWSVSSNAASQSAAVPATAVCTTDAGCTGSWVISINNNDAGGWLTINNYDGTNTLVGSTIVPTSVCTTMNVNAGSTMPEAGASDASSDSSQE